MRRLDAVVVGLVALVLASPVAAQDPVKVAPDMYKLIFENEQVRVLEVSFAPGEKIGKHSHPDHFAYILDGGKLKISKPDGTSNEADFQVGQVVWIPAETHSGENVGETPIRVLVVEMKEAAKEPVKKAEEKKK